MAQIHLVQLQTARRARFRESPKYCVTQALHLNFYIFLFSVTLTILFLLILLLHVSDLLIPYLSIISSSKLNCNFKYDAESNHVYCRLFLL